LPGDSYNLLIIQYFGQFLNNARVVGCFGKEKHVDLEEFRRTVKKVLLNPSYSEKAKHYSKKPRMFGGPEKAAQLIEDFVRNRKRG
jgi:UDP:flavonoid glycosyltransferase YjiC (YdhE family)